MWHPADHPLPAAGTHQHPTGAPEGAAAASLPLPARVEGKEIFSEGPRQLFSGGEGAPEIGLGSDPSASQECPWHRPRGRSSGLRGGSAPGREERWLAAHLVDAALGATALGRPRRLRRARLKSTYTHPVWRPGAGGGAPPTVANRSFARGVAFAGGGGETVGFDARNSITRAITCRR